MARLEPYTSEDIRNVAFVGHSHSGKTALSDAILFDDGVTTRLGSTAEETSAFDYEPEEIKRGGSIFSHFGWVQHGGKKINIIDTPGDQNFFLDSLTSLTGADSAVFVISATDGAQLQTKKAWSFATERHLSRVIFINKMDRFTGNWKDLVNNVANGLHAQPVPVQIPVGTGENFAGVVGLLRRKVMKWQPDGSGKMTVEEISGELKDEVAEAYSVLMDSIVSTDDALLEEYLEKGEISEEKARAAFVKAVSENKLVPILFGSATLNMGVQPLLDLCASALPHPLAKKNLVCKNEKGEDTQWDPSSESSFLAQVIHTSFDDHAGQVSVLRVFSGLPPKDGHIKNATTGEEVRLGSVFSICGQERTKLEKVISGDIISTVKLKNTHTNNTLCAVGEHHQIPGIEYPQPMISYVLIPESKGDDDKLKQAVDRLMEEDPTLSTSIDELSHRMILNGMGHAHLENAVERMKRKFKVSVKTDLPAVSYRETFASAIKEVEGKHKKQSGGAGQFGVCFIDVEPNPRDAGFEFINKIYGGAIPRQYIPSVEKGVVERTKKGLLAGYPVVDFKVTLTDGKHHPVDSKDIAFQMAGSKAIKAAMEKAGMKLLEPFYKMEIVVPTENSGDVMGDITSRRGHVDGMDNHEDTTIIHATCPLSEVQRYVPDLRSMTGGKGTFMMVFDSYKELPAHLVDKIRKESPFLKDS